MSVPRIKSETGFYHVMNRGVALMTIFEDDDDRRVFLRLLAACAKRVGVEVHAYCLMGNHYHLLIRDDKDGLSRFSRHLNASYAKYFNERYGRAGPLFQSRFRSEVVKGEDHYLTVLRYIVQNPLKAGLGAVEDYPWSSYGEYGRPHPLIEPLCAIELCGDLDRLRAFLREPADGAFLDIPKAVGTSDDALRAYIREAFDARAVDIACMQKGDRDSILRSLLDAGFSMRRIERVTGIGRGVLQRLSR